MYATLDNNNKKKEAHTYGDTLVLCGLLLFCLCFWRIEFGEEESRLSYILCFFFIETRISSIFFSLSDSYGILLQTYQNVDDDGDDGIVSTREKNREKLSGYGMIMVSSFFCYVPLWIIIQKDSYIASYM